MTQASISQQSCLLKLNALGLSRPDKAKTLFERFGPELFELKPEILALEAKLDIDTAEHIISSGRRFNVEDELERAEKSGITVITCDDERYPDLLREIEDAPLALYCRGELLREAGTIAVVGSRFPTPYGRRMATRLSADAAAAGLCVVSGLARGIDAEAHKAALRVSGRTWAVLGTGLDRIYPSENKYLAEELIGAGGCLISEFPLGTAPLPHNFPRRNRIVSGLSWATVVIEGRMHSGSLITARLAANQGRAVLAVPGPADSPLSAAPHRLISEGARLAVNLADILGEMPPRWRGRAEARTIKEDDPTGASTLSLEHKKILRCLGAESLTLEELSQISGIDLFKLSTIIFELEISNLVISVPGQRYAKKGS